jgi:uncharacterized membrane protein YidH (DUF202 family)
MNEEKLSSEDRGTEYLANKRTFLASIRTGIAVLSLGFLVARFGLWLREMSGRFSPRVHREPHRSIARQGRKLDGPRRRARLPRRLTEVEG